MAILVTPREHYVASPGPPKAAVGLLARGYAFMVVSLRLVIIGGWAAAVAAAIVLAITTAGVALAASFAMLAVIPRAKVG